MENLFINKWWGNYIGGCDDSFLLLDYFGTSPSDNWSLKQIYEDIHLDSAFESGDIENADLYFELEPGLEGNFNMGIDVIIDLSAILLECLHNKQVAIRDLDKSSEYEKNITISTTKQDILLLKNGLNEFINNPQSSELAVMVGEHELAEIVHDCKAVNDELGAFIK
ncbi:MAG: hypothetical protein LBU74_04900 [Methanobacteriaceae archaeon]|nr:hypothetical protein [Candidatus Methanorudis spinitermitis]